MRFSIALTLESSVTPVVRNLDFEKHNDKMGDELENPEWELEEEKIVAETSKVVSWPTSLYAYIKFGYENTMKAQLEADGITFSKWIDSAMTHVQSYYQHESLPTQILFKVYNYKCIYGIHVVVSHDFSQKY